VAKQPFSMFGKTRQFFFSGISNINLTPAAAALVLTPGTPSFSFSGSFTLTPAPAALVITGGTPSISPDDNINLSPAPAALVLTPGTPVMTFTGSITLSPEPAVLRLFPGTPGMSFVTTVGSGNTLLIGGVSYLFDENSPATIIKRMSAAWSATFSIVYTSGSKPQCGQEVALFWNSIKRFGGVVQTVAESRIKGPTNKTRLLVTCTGFQSYLNRVVIAELYAPDQSEWQSIVKDVWSKKLAQFGVSMTIPQGPTGGSNEQKYFHYLSGGEVFNQIRDGNAGWDYWIDDNKVLEWKEQGTGTAAPFTLRDGDVNQDQVSVTTNNAKFRNHQCVLTSAVLSDPVITDTFVVLPEETVFYPPHTMPSKPVVYLNGTEEGVQDPGAWDGVSAWYWYSGLGTGVAGIPSISRFDPPGVPAMSPGDIVTLGSQSPFPGAFCVEDTASIAAVGLYESVFQAKDIVNKDDALALAQALLDAYGTDGDFPQSVKFTYNSKSQPAWLLPGMVVDVNRTFPPAVGNYVVEEMQATLEKLQVWRFSITLRAGLGDVSESFERDFIRAGRLWVNVPPTVGTFGLGLDIPGLTNPGLALGVQADTYRLRGSGFFGGWDGQFSQNPPTGDDLIIDLLYSSTGLLADATSIFPSGDANKIVIPDGTTSPRSGFKFVTTNYPYVDGAVIFVNVVQVGSTWPGSNGLVHLNLKPNAALPPP